jgi:hypothetical protein
LGDALSAPLCRPYGPSLFHVSALPRGCRYRMEEMMDIHALINAVLDGHRQDRTRYHLTLGKLTEALENTVPAREVRTDTGSGIGREHSYRGYYDDLSFAAVEHSTAGDLLKACKRAATDTYEGWKGGDFTYGPDTPLWFAEHGCCGLAIVGLRDGPDGALILETKDTDE